ncbi:MAG: undecaprenyldiphospho-muramoylpentapeptide beta-N-acetylglucosaminyltransferase [Candidatus Melainabacteria bacterium]|mgnify:FL=1|nr:MAG: undecaprenyldiphospho-muramoylpentapeptide beta-N-acetylglucosaminyltransferase [Candidatus Melainabacteria bacterium]
MSDTCKKKYTYFITGGGTGGHIYPAIAIAEALRKDETTKDIYYIGNPNNLEYGIVKKAHFKFLPIKVSGMPRKIGWNFIKWGIELELANWKALYYLWRFKPDAILGTGGYVSAPALMASNLSKTPYMIHDCDAQPGMVSKFVAPMAKQVSLAFEDSASYIRSNNISINGNPIREQFKTLTKEQARQNMNLENKTTITIMGGSQGAKSIDDATIQCLKQIFEKYDVQVIFQTGAKHYENTIKALEDVYPEFEHNKNLVIKPYFDDMVTALKATDIAISRAGSLSLSEICACGIAPILVPYPYAAADHQRKNAKSLLNKNACLYLEDKETTGETLLEKLDELLSDPEKLASIQANTRALAKLDATQTIVEQLKKVASHE